MRARATRVDAQEETGKLLDSYSRLRLNNVYLIKKI